MTEVAQPAAAAPTAVGLVLIAHQPLAGAWTAVLKHVFGANLTQFGAIDVIADEDPAAVEARLATLCGELDTGAGTLILTDMFGATPSNIAVRLLMRDEPPQAALVAGASLPMLLRAVSYRSLPLAALQRKVVDGGLSGVVCFPAND